MTDVLTGMGAIPHPHGTAFRVWAPNADTVDVVGDFNDWTAGTHSLRHEADGYWYTDVAAARPGQEYKFRLVNGQQEFFRNDPYAKQVTNSVGNSIIVDHAAYDWEGDAFQLPSFNDLVIYEMHVGSFIQSDDGPATLDEVRARLDHLVELGVNVVQLMPVMEFAGDYSWGYNPAHIFAVESSYGGPVALKDFIKAAHHAGLGVIIDVVYNHFGPSDLDIWQFDGWHENDKGGIYFYNDWRSRTPWGDTRPDYGRTEVRNFIRDNAYMWLHDYHADGLRYDMTPYIASVAGTPMDIPDGWDLMRWINESIRRDFNNKLLIAEDLHSNPLVTQDGNGGANFHAQWDARFVHPIRESVILTDDGARSAHTVADALTFRYGLDAFSRIVYTESHDEVANGKARVPQEINPEDPDGYHSQKRSTAGAALMLTAPGIPMLFQGQEFLQGQYFRDDVPLDWHHDDEFQGIVKLYRDMIALRLNRRGSTAGLTGQYIDILHVHDDNDVVAYHRWKEGGCGDDVVVVANLSHREYGNYRIGFPHAGLWRLELNSDARLYSADFTDSDATDITATTDGYDGRPASAELVMGPYSVLVYSRQA